MGRTHQLSHRPGARPAGPIPLEGNTTLTDNTTATAEAPAADENTDQAPMFTALQQFRLHAVSVLGPAFHERVAAIVSNVNPRKLTAEVDDFIEAAHRLAHFIGTGEKPTDTPPATAAPAEPPTDGQ